MELIGKKDRVAVFKPEAAYYRYFQSDGCNIFQM